MEKGYTKKKYRRKIPKVGRSYLRHMNEDKTFDKSCDINDLVEELFLEKADKIPGGLAQGKSPKDFDKKALEAGIKVEMEHTSDRKAATEIAMDHLTEDPKYYEKLKTIEKSMYKMCKACGTDKCDGKECLMKKQGVPKGADPATHERCVKDVKKQGKDKSSAYAIYNAAGAGMKKSIDEMIDGVLEKGGPGSGRKGNKTLDQINKETIDAKKRMMDNPEVKKLKSEYLSLMQKENPNEEDSKRRKEIAIKLDKLHGFKKSNNEEENMNKSTVETEIKQMADQMAKSTQDPKLELIETIKELGAEGLKKALPELSDSQKELVKSVLEEISKGKQAVAMDANYDGDKKFAKLANMGTEVENGSDDEDEKLMMQSAASHNPQGDVSPEGREGQVIKGEKMEEKREGKAGKKVAEAVDGVAEGEAEEAMEEHEKEMHKKKMKKSLEELQALKDEVIKSYEDAGLSYNDELVKSEMKKRLLKEEDQVEMGGQDKGGKKDRADKKSEPEIEVAKDADETADEATAKVGKMKKSLPEFDTQANLRANTLGRNHHFSVNDYYDQVLAKSEESEAEGEENSEELSKSEKEDDLNDIIAKGYDKTMTDVAEEELHKSQVKGKFAKSSFSDKDLADAFGMTEEEYNKMLNQ